MKQNPLRCLCLILSLLYFTVLPLQAAEVEPVNDQEVVSRANQLLELLDHLLLDENDSSIQQIINHGDASTKALIEESLRLKTEGEQLLSDNEPMQAAITLQSALDHVFMAIRQEEGQGANPKALSAKLEERFKANDTFLEAATRVIATEQNKDAGQLLEQAREARARADVESGVGDEEAALSALAESTQLAQQAIMTVRNGQEIERRQ